MKNKYLLLTVIFLFSFLGFSTGKPILPHNPVLLSAPIVYPDMDDDGFFSMIGISVLNLDISIPRQITIGNDCNDSDPEFHPGAVYYKDADGDGYGNLPLIITACEDITGYVLINGDCNDQNALINPDTFWYRDYDGDGYGDIAYAYINNPQCQQPQGYVLDYTDCNDNISSVHQVENWYADADGDGYGSGTPTSSCGPQVGGYVNNNFDTCPTVSGPYEGCQIPNSSVTYGGGKKNYIISTIPKAPVTSTQSITHSYDATVNITYFDGLGRPNQQIASAQSGTGKNIVTPIEYDAFGRQVKEYLPYSTTTSGLDYVNTALNDQPNFSQYSGQVSYSEKIVEASPLNRVMEQAAPGNDWSVANGHTIKLDYQTNTATDAVKLFTVTATWDIIKGLYDIPTSLTATTYGDFQLYKTITKDENWVTASGNNNTTEEFKDKEGRFVLKRTYGVSMGVNTQHNTYYVYDQYGNLTFVIPPLVDTSVSITTAILEKLCYQYKYDYRNRLVEKKLPGKQWEFIVYDKLDRVVATGPANSPFTNVTSTGWMLTKYDFFNRPVLTAWQPSTTAITSATRKTLQDLYSVTTLPLSETKTTTNTTVNSVLYRYTNTAIPTANATLYHVLTVNYYDDYDSNLVFSPFISFTANADVYYNNTTNKPKGLPTMSWVRVPSTSTATSFEQSYTLYDAKARAVSTFTRNYVGGYTQTDTKLDFVGKVNYSLTTHKRTNTTSIPLLTIREDFTYSDQDRLLTHTHTINGGTPQLLASNTYNELGQLISKKVGRSVANPIQKVDYSYNIRGWLKGINDVTNLTDPAAPSANAAIDLFAFKINYNTQNNNIIGVKNLYNGNISETFWRTNKDNILRSYGYTYDDLNRLRNAQYIRPVNPLLPNTNLNPIVNTFNESLQYDKNGNIVALQRNGGMESQSQFPLIDDLVYQYDGNQLTKVTDNTNNSVDGFKDGVNLPVEYIYDLNGNMTTDQNKGLTTITYNHLNLPTKIMISGGTINYSYNALGQKVFKTVSATNVATSTITTSNTEYLGEFQYNNGVLQFIPTAEGYVKNTVVNGANTYDYIFNYTDHLGNIRLSYGIAPVTQILTIFEENNYYPFGMKHATYNYQLKTIENLKDVPSLNTTSDYKATVTIDPDPIGNVQITRNSGYQYKFQGQERQDELGLNWDSFKWRNYDYAIGRFMGIDPLAERHPQISPFVYCANNPIKFIDPDGRDWVESNNGDITWRKDVNSKNQSKTLKDGEIYRGKSYERIKDWNGVTDSSGNTVNNIVLEEYGKNKKMTYSELESVNVSVEGSMREGNSKLGDVEVKINLTFANGKTRFMDQAYSADAGGFGNGAPENGNYTITNYQDRSPTGWYSKGMNNNGVGFSFNLNPSFSTGRTDLRIHPDGNNEGTLGCIGMSGSAAQLNGFSNNLRSVQKYQTSVPATLDITGNPNNNGRSGAKIPNVNE